MAGTMREEGGLMRHIYKDWHRTDHLRKSASFRRGIPMYGLLDGRPYVAQSGQVFRTKVWCHPIELLNAVKVQSSKVAQ